MFSPTVAAEEWLAHAGHPDGRKKDPSVCVNGCRASRRDLTCLIWAEELCADVTPIEYCKVFLQLVAIRPSARSDVTEMPQFLQHFHQVNPHNPCIKYDVYCSSTIAP